MKRAAASCCYSISRSCFLCFLHYLRQLARHSMGWDGPHWVGDSVWRMIEVPACAEHFKYLQRYFKKRFRHVLLPLPTPPGRPARVYNFAGIRFLSNVLLIFWSSGRKRVGSTSNAAWGLSVSCALLRLESQEGRKGLEGDLGAWLRHLSACVLLGKCQKPLVKKPYGNYSTQLNMKCGKGSAAQSVQACEGRGVG